MKLKKILCAVTALTMSISSFAGLTLSAKADAVDAYVIKVDDAKASGTWTASTVNDGILGVATSKVSASQDTTYSAELINFTTTGAGGYTYKLSDTIGSSTKYKVSFDYLSQIGGSGRSMNISLLDSAGNQIMNLNVGTRSSASERGYSTFGGDQTTSKSSGILVSASNTTWCNVTAAVADSKLALTVNNGSTDIVSLSDVTWGTGVGQVAYLAVSYGYNLGSTYIKNIKASVYESTTIGSVEISGDDSVESSAGSAQYTATVKNSDSYEVEDTVTWSLSSDSEDHGCSIDASTGVLTTTEGKGGTVTLTATSVLDNTVSGTKTVTVVSTVGFKLTTTPYSLVYVGDSTTAVNSGYTGVVELDKSYADNAEHTVKITKNGYTDKTVSMKLPTGTTSDAITLTPSTNGVTYYEDFSNVTDGFKFAGSIGTVSNGVLSAGGTSTGDTAYLPETVAIEGKLITLTTSFGTFKRHAYLELIDSTGATGISLYHYSDLSSKAELRVNDAKTGTGEYYYGNTSELQFYVSGGTLKAYHNGKLYKTTTTKLADLNAIHMISSGGTNYVNIDDITVSTKPEEYTLTTVDGDTTTATTYLSGSTATLPSATGTDTFVGWSDGTNTYAAGTEVTVSADVTYTALYSSADITTTGVLDKTAGTLTYTSTVNSVTNAGTAMKTGDELATKGFVFVDLSDDGIAAEGSATKQEITEKDADGNGGFLVGDSFRIIVKDSALSAVETIGVYAIPYIFINESDTTPLWGTPSEATISE